MAAPLLGRAFTCHTLRLYLPHPAPAPCHILHSAPPPRLPRTSPPSYMFFYPVRSVSLRGILCLYDAMPDACDRQPHACDSQPCEAEAWLPCILVSYPNSATRIPRSLASPPLRARLPPTPELLERIPSPISPLRPHPPAPLIPPTAGWPRGDRIALLSLLYSKREEVLCARGCGSASGRGG